MTASSSTQQSLRKAIGALKDSTKVGIVNLNSDNKGLDIAIVKATNHDEVVPKEKHIQTILDAVSPSRPREDVAYCIQGLAKRLTKTRCWTVALKTLIVIHRALREVDRSFCEALIKYRGGRSLMLNLSHFRDDSSPKAWDYSAWVRTYALYLEERVECFRLLRLDVEKESWNVERLDTANLLDQLPPLQQLLYRLLGCKPEGASIYNSLIHYALSVVVSESVKLYVTITDGILSLLDKYFEMQRHDAVRALDIYRKSGNQAESLSEFFEICRGLDFGRGQKFVKIEKPPASFMKALEDYVKEAPQPLVFQCTAIDGDQVSGLIEARKEETIPEAAVLINTEALTPEADLLTDNQDYNVKEPPPTVPEPQTTTGDQSDTEATPQITDLLGLEALKAEASTLDEKNSLALAIVTSEIPSNSGNDFISECQTKGWELALVTAPTSSSAAVAERKLAGGFDRLTLDSLYEDAMARQANQNAGYNSGQPASNTFSYTCTNQDPFNASRGIAPPTNVQMALLAEQQNLVMQQQGGCQQLSIIHQNPNNPFGNPCIEQSLPPQNSYSGLILGFRDQQTSKQG